MSVSPQLPHKIRRDIRHKLPRSTPEAQGVDSAHLGDLLEAISGQLHEVHSVMVLRHGHVILEGWRAPFAPEIPHQLFSLSKSFTATAIGIAIADGLLRIDDLVTTLLPDDLPEVVSDHLRALTVEHLLTMTTGHALDTIGGPRISASVSVDSMRHASLDDEPGNNEWGDNWAREILAIPLEFEPGTQFVYNSGATYLLAAILAKITGERLLDYLTPRLFTPLGIARATWQQCPRGIDIGAYGLSLNTEDVAAFGQLYLQNGLWNGQQLVPTQWVQAAGAAQVRNDTPAPGDLVATDPAADVFPNKIQGYGYQFWRGLHNSYRGDGAFGQYCIVVPDQDVVVVYTSGVSDMQALLELTWEHLIPALAPASVGALPVNVAAQARLQSLAADLVVPLPVAHDGGGGAVDAAFAPDTGILGTSFTVAPDRLGVDFEVDITEFTLREEGGGGGGTGTSAAATILRFTDSLGEREIVCANTDPANRSQAIGGSATSGWRMGAMMPMGGRPTPVAAASVWLSARVWQLRLQYVETPYALTLTFRFSPETSAPSAPATRAARTVTIEATQNVAFGATDLGILRGSAEHPASPASPESPQGTKP